jgi:2-amino-4-hydroxy-6-hydroxymethyldihydropteridine diphosphokinase
MKPPSRWTTAYIGLGANLGDARDTLSKALNALAQLPSIVNVQRSAYYRSAPVQANGPDFVNAVAKLETTLPPKSLLAALQNVENDFGRQRPYKNAPRTLDIDLLLYDDLVMDDPVLTLPHPRLHERAFVLLPLKNLAPELHLAQGSFDTLLAQCHDQDISELP